MVKRCRFVVAEVGVCCDWALKPACGDEVEEGEHMEASSKAKVGPEEVEESDGLSSGGCVYIWTGDGVAACIWIAGICRRLGFWDWCISLREGYAASGGRRDDNDGP